MPMWLNWQSSWFVISRLSVRVRSSAYRHIRTISSVGQSSRLITGRSWVRVPDGPLKRRKKNKASWLSWLERRPVTAEVAGSSPAGVVCSTGYGIIAQLGEHLPYKQRVIGSSPIGPTRVLQAGVAELADAQDLKSCCRNTVPVRFRSPALRKQKRVSQRQEKENMCA